MEEVLRKLEADLGPITGEPEPLREGITNRNFRVRFGELLGDVSLGFLARSVSVVTVPVAALRAVKV